MKHKAVDPQVADNLDTLMGVDASKKHENKPHHDVKPKTAQGLTSLMGISVNPTSHDKQLRGREESGNANGKKADAVLGADISGGKSRDGSCDSIKGKAKKVLGA